MSNHPDVIDKYRMVDGVLHERYVASPVRVTCGISTQLHLGESSQGAGPPDKAWPESLWILSALLIFFNTDPCTFVSLLSVTWTCGWHAGPTCVDGICRVSGGNGGWDPDKAGTDSEERARLKEQVQHPCQPPPHIANPNAVTQPPSRCYC
jgi:hypothetical protein